MVLNCITLPQRRHLIKSEVDRLNIRAVLWDAVVLPNTITAISQSHKKIVRNAKICGKKLCAIAEDDCIFTSENGWNYFLENLPQDFDIYLSSFYSGVPLEDKSLHGFSGLTCYVISERFYDTFLSLPENKNIDRAMTGMGKFLFCDPFVTKQRNGYSFHRKKEVNDEHYLAGRKFLT